MAAIIRAQQEERQREDERRQKEEAEKQRILEERRRKEEVRRARAAGAAGPGCCLSRRWTCAALPLCCFGPSTSLSIVSQRPPPSALRPPPRVLQEEERELEEKRRIKKEKAEAKKARLRVRCSSLWCHAPRPPCGPLAPLSQLLVSTLGSSIHRPFQAEGKLLSKSEKERQRLAQIKLEQMRAMGLEVRRPLRPLL